MKKSSISLPSPSKSAEGISCKETILDYSRFATSENWMKHRSGCQKEKNTIARAARLHREQILREHGGICILPYSQQRAERSTGFLRPQLTKFCLNSRICLMLEAKLQELLNVIESPFASCINTISNLPCGQGNYIFVFRIFEVFSIESWFSSEMKKNIHSAEILELLPKAFPQKAGIWTGYVVKDGWTSSWKSCLVWLWF